MLVEFKLQIVAVAPQERVSASEGRLACAARARVWNGPLALADEPLHHGRLDPQAPEGAHRHPAAGHPRRCAPPLPPPLPESGTDHPALLATRHQAAQCGRLRHLVPLRRGPRRDPLPGALVRLPPGRSGGLSADCPLPPEPNVPTSPPTNGFQGEVFALKFRFDNAYPISAPAVQFVNDGDYHTPVHPVCPFADKSVQPLMMLCSSTYTRTDT